jgi:hypothetical protein
MAGDRIVELIFWGVAVAAAVAVPLVLFVIGSRIANAMRDRKVKSIYVELATAILSEVPDTKRHDEEQRSLRKWAAQVFDAHSSIKLPESTRNALVARMPLVEPDPGVRIRVEDNQGAPIPGAHVQLIEFAEGYRMVRASSWTDGNGEIGFGYLRGSWVPIMVSVKADGFRHFLSEVSPLSHHHGRVIVLQASAQQAGE